MTNTAYLLWMAGSTLLTCVLFCLINRKLKKHILLSVLSFPLLLIGGILGSKLIYMLLQLDFVIADGWKESLLNTHPETFSFAGGVVGVCAGVIMCARLTGNRPVETLNAFAPAGLLLASLARFGEYFLAGEFMTGTGPYLEEDSTLCFFPAAVNCSTDPEWSEWYLAVFMMTGAVMLILAIVSAFAFRRNCFVRSLFYFCLPQIILENLLNNVIWWIFCVRVEQALYMAVMLVILVIYAIRAGKGGARFLPVVTAVLCIGLFVVAEFAMEQKIEFLSFLSVGDCYVIMAVGTLLLLAAELYGMHRLKKTGKPLDD